MSGRVISLHLIREVVAVSGLPGQVRLHVVKMYSTRKTPAFWCFLLPLPCVQAKAWCLGAVHQPWSRRTLKTAGSGQEPGGPFPPRLVFPVFDEQCNGRYFRLARRGVWASRWQGHEAARSACHNQNPTQTSGSRSSSCLQQRTLCG